jgi:hypothetical protein
MTAGLPAPETPYNSIAFLRSAGVLNLCVDGKEHLAA